MTAARVGKACADFEAVSDNFGFQAEVYRGIDQSGAALERPPKDVLSDVFGFPGEAECDGLSVYRCNVDRIASFHVCRHMAPLALCGIFVVWSVFPFGICAVDR